MKYQAHIDGLRGIAVIAVVLFHAYPNFITGGYVGVDLFFVISGYLITSIIVDDLKRHQFALHHFYARRIRRIFPALIMVLLASFAAGWLFLLADEFSLLGQHIAAGASFTSNLLLWREHSYFDVLSDLKPLLHLWSLGIEEQFYLIWPWLLVFGAKEGRLRMVVAFFTAVSLVLNLILIWHFPSATFYLPLTRFWELGIGGMIALHWSEMQCLDLHKKRTLGFVGLALVIISIISFQRAWTFPGFWALIPVTGIVLVLLYAKSTHWTYLILSSRLLVSIGLISFPFYLWHWPLLSFYRILSQSYDNVVVGCILVIAIGLAGFTFHYIEKPIRLRSALSSAKYLVILMAVIFLVGIYTVAREGFPFRKYSQYDPDMRWHSWSDVACERQYGIEPCQERVGLDSIFLLGDSHANQLYPGLEVLWDGGVANIGSCIPVNANVFLADPTFSEVVKGNNCFVENVFEKQVDILNHLKPKYVVISVAWDLYFNHSDLAQFSKSDRQHYQKIQQALLVSIRKIQSLGAKVVLMEAIPRNIKLPKNLCGLRQRPEPQSCIIPYNQFTKGISWQMLREVKEQNPQIELIKTQDLFCQNDQCQLIQDGKLLFRDEWHLSYSGSLLIGNRIVDKLSMIR